MAKDEKMISEDVLQTLEANFPALSSVAFAEAAKRSLDAGETVTQAKGRFVYHVFPDGQRKVVKEIPEPIQMKVGTKFRIR